MFSMNGMTNREHNSAATLNGPFLGSHSMSEGVLTKKQLYSPLFRRLFHNVYLPAGIPITHELRCRAAALAAPEQAVLTGVSAAVIHGLDLAKADDPIEFVVPESARLRYQSGMHVRRTKIQEVTSENWKGIRIATPLRMTMDMLTNTKLHKSLPRAVGLLD